MSVLNDSTVLRTVEDGRALLSSAFLEFCVKVRNNDPSVLPDLAYDGPLSIRRLSEKEDIELADALLENTTVTYLQLKTDYHKKSSAEAMAKYVRTSKRLQRIQCIGSWNNRELQHREEIICCFLRAFRESTSLKELHMEFPFIDGSSNLAL
jgi:hypothetical protein